VATAPAEAPSRKRLAEALLTRSDIGVADVREKLQTVEQLQQQGKIADAVQELLSIGQFYLLRTQPMKAVQVLRQAARMQPEAIEVQAALGEALAQIKLVEDAAQAYRRAAAMLEQQQRFAEWLAVAKRMLDLDPDDLHARLRVAEDLSRAGRNLDAADVFRSLAEALLVRGETDDWEKVGERLLHHDPSDTTIAHDLALHYVRSGRHALALPKLLLCYEVEPGDAELLELIVDTLEAVGQREKAATICRQLLHNYRRTGLRAEAERTLERLYGLDPEDAEARQFIGVLSSTIADGTVIDFDAGAESGFKHRLSGAYRAVQAPPEDDEAGFDGPTTAMAASPQSVRGMAPPTPRMPASVAPPARTTAGQGTADEDLPFGGDDRTVMEDIPAALARLGIHTPDAPPLPSSSVQQPPPSERSVTQSLPRPRLARRFGTMTDLPSAQRDITKDLGTLDFFIERGFYEPAVALLDDLQRRHPGHSQLDSYRERIAQMQR
jgi:tetratricopeptide (TPR) repeat protein